MEDSKTTVVHCMREPYDVYIGRGIAPHPGKEEPGLGNPFVIGQHGDRAKVIDMYRRYAVTRFATDPAFAKRVRGLKGKRIGCWCKPNACHGDVLKALAESEQV